MREQSIQNQDLNAAQSTHNVRDCRDQAVVGLRFVPFGVEGFTGFVCVVATYGWVELE